MNPSCPIITNDWVASGLLGRQVQKVFSNEGWKAIGTGLNRISPPEVIKLDILNTKEIDRVLDEVKYEHFSFLMSNNVKLSMPDLTL